MAKILSAILFLFYAFIVGCSESAITEAIEKDSNIEGSTAREAAPEEKSSTSLQDPAEKVEKPRKTVRRWRKIASWEGSKSKKTQPFEVKGNEWKIRWKVKKGKKNDSEFIIILQNYEDKDDKEIIAQQVGPGEDDFTFEGGQGTYILDITAEQPYIVEVFEYK
ncbi:MAG: hypothetical protein RML72_05455 [Bacteroidia bacterium]|nr:hypothetical protein [Bacteroidia bacterium]MDW8158309.1 hypothetical protein [Bacteroidia bacterium]